MQRLCAALVLALVMGGCGDRREELPEAAEWEIHEDLRIGEAGGPEPPLGRVGGVLAAPDGGVWVLQPTERDIRVYGADGSLVRRVGRGGQGSGEFTLPNRMGWWGGDQDTVWVADLGLRRLNLFSAAGEFATSFDLPFVQYEEDYQINQPGAVLTDGSALALAAYNPRVAEWQSFPLVRYDVYQGQVLQELARFDRSASVSILWEGEGLSTAVHPIPDAPLVAYAPDGSRVLVVDRSTDADRLGRVRLVMMSPRGDTLWRRELPYEPEPLGQAEVDSLMAPRISGLLQLTRLEGRLSDDQARQAFQQSVRVPSHRPPVQAALVGPDGRIFLAWAAPPGVPDTWWVLDADGRPVGRFTPPADLDVRAVGTDVLWALETEGATSRLVRYRLTETDG